MKRDPLYATVTSAGCDELREQHQAHTKKTARGKGQGRRAVEKMDSRRNQVSTAWGPVR